MGEAVTAREEGTCRLQSGQKIHDPPNFQFLYNYRPCGRLIFPSHP